MHPLWLPALLFLAAFAARESWSYVATGKTPKGTALWEKWGGTALIVALVGVWIARFFGAFGGPVDVSY